MQRIKKAVIVVHREESTEDFKQIARRMHKLDPSIGVAMLPSYVTSKMVPPEFLHVPLLVVYLVNPPPQSFSVAAKLAVEPVDKIEEYDHFKKHDLPCLPIQRFEWGMELDPELYGDLVVLKPEYRNSTGKDINMLPTCLISSIKPSDFPHDHFIHTDTYLVQKFVKTGEYPTHDRVLVFLDEILYSRRSMSAIPYPAPNADVQELLRTTVATNTQDKMTEFCVDAEVNELALRVAKTFPDRPLFGLDIIREESTGWLYVLEANLGGNTWHFSSKLAHRTSALRKALILQYNAWDRAAAALVRKTRELAT